ncbi:Protein kinase domain [Dillenia turbinata]|uniref:non-specific serine/threonine protein kinase n=1 Tax=Dillenia turbinata TaxID=194707 RepID=A0AAN8V3V9_9MAGN
MSLSLFFVILLPCFPLFSSAKPLYPDCALQYNCGSIQNITYPFTGSNRPVYCGPPEFQLNCRSDSMTEITVNSQNYRVLNIDQKQNKLTLARSDYYNNVCPHEYTNTTLNSAVFTFPTNLEKLTIFYGCSSVETLIKPINQLLCNVSGVSTTAYYFIGPVPSDPILHIIECDVSVEVPVFKTVTLSLALSSISLEDALMQGFDVVYKNPYDGACSKCLNFGGECGFDSNLNEPICICGDKLCDVQGNSTKSVGLGIGIAIGGAGIVGILVTILYCHFVHKKKKQIDYSKSQKVLLGAPSSKVLSSANTSSAISQSQSIPSFPYSKSVDPEKGSTYFGVQVFSYQELEEATNNFDPSREIGDGGFGTVYYGQLNDGRIVAVKRLYENNITRVKQFLNEVEILTHLEHDNLVKLYGCTSRRSRELLLVYEYIPNGTVADHLHGKRAKYSSLSWSVRLGIAVETADALAYLHASDVIHRDVKTTNILLDNDFRVKVADFGLSRLFPTDVTHVSTAPQGTLGYVDPEYYQCYQLTDKSDVYSFGVVLVELISAKQAVDVNRHRMDINLANMAINKIQNKTLHELVDPSLGYERDYNIKKMITAVAELAFRCLQQEKEMRPGMGEVLKVLKEIKNEDLSLRKAEVLDMSADDVGLLKSEPPPISPESNETDKCVSDQSQPHSI